jgi:hypothetical protein
MDTFQKTVLGDKSKLHTAAYSVPAFINVWKQNGDTLAMILKSRKALMAKLFLSSNSDLTRSLAPPLGIVPQCLFPTYLCCPALDTAALHSPP